MYSGTQRSYGSRSGIQTSQFISRDPRANDPIALGNISENFNRFLTAHSRKTASHSSRKFRLNEYFTKDLKAKRSSTHHFLCGPLNTKRLTRKTISGNFGDEPTTQPLNVADLYNNSKQINNKPPWIEQSEPNDIPECQEKPSKPKTISFDLNSHLCENSTDDTGLVGKEQVLKDGEVPDPIHIDLKDSCPLYDSNEYEQCPNPIDEEVSDDENSEPDISRYNFFVGHTEKLSNVDVDFRKKYNRRIRRKPLPREKVFVPLLTSSQGYGFSITE